MFSVCGRSYVDYTFIVECGGMKARLDSRARVESHTRPRKHGRISRFLNVNICEGEAGLVMCAGALERVAGTPQDVAITAPCGAAQATAPSSQAVHVQSCPCKSTCNAVAKEAMRDVHITSTGAASAALATPARASAAAAPACEGSGPDRLNSGSLRSGRGRCSSVGVHLASANRLHSVATGRSIHKKSSCTFLCHTTASAAA